MSFSSEDAAKVWLRVAFGDAVAHDVLLLPADLREGLYGDVLRWGPAGNEIQAFFVALRERFAGVGVVTGAALFPLSEIRDPSLSFTVADGDPTVVYLVDVLEAAGWAATNKFWIDGVGEWLVTFAVLALSSPWFPESLPQFAPYVPHMNELLCRFGLPPMSAVVEKVAHV